MTFTRRGDRRTGQRGTTLIEQIMVITIIAILAGIAMPAMSRLLTRNQLQVAQTDFIAALNHARSTAVHTGTLVVLCPSQDGTQCSADTRWDSGWLLGHDRDHDNQPDGSLLRVGQAYAGTMLVRSTAGRRRVRFQPDGSASGSNITLLFCHPGHVEHVLSVVVSNSGRIRGATATAAQAASCAADS